jgi:hypothetical protein
MELETRRARVHPDVELVFTTGVAVAPSAPARSLPEPSIPVSGVRVVASLGWDDSAASVRVVCAQSASDRWIPGLEDLVFDSATGLARAQVADLKSIGLSASRVVGVEGARRTLHGETTHSAISGAHVLAFVGPSRDALLCTLTCVEGVKAACAPILETARFEGKTTQAPAASATVQAALAFADHPLWGVGVAALIALVATGLVLARRPRPRP